MNVFAISIDFPVDFRRSLQEQLGQTNITVTQRYSRLTSDFKRPQVNLMNDLCGEIKKVVKNW